MTPHRRAQRGEFAQHWLILLACSLCTSIGAVGLNGYASAVLFPHMVHDLGITRAALASTNLVYALAVLIGAPLVGAMMDRVGILGIVFASLCAECVIFALYMFVPHGPSSIVWLAALGGALALLAMGTSPIGFARIVSARFRHARGFALALMTGSQGVAAMLTPLVLSPIVSAGGWRRGEATLAVVAAVVGFPSLLLIVFARRREAASAPTITPVIAASSDWSAFRRPLSWILLFGFFIAPLSATGWLIQFADLVAQRGVSPAVAARTLSLVGGAILVGRLASGILLDRLATGWVVFGFFATAAAGCLAFPLLPTGGLWLAAIAMAFIIGAEQDVLPFIVARYFGLTNTGKLYGALYGGFIIGGGLSVLVLVILAKAVGLSTAFFLSSAVLMIAGTGLLAALTLADWTMRADNGPGERLSRS